MFHAINHVKTGKKVLLRYETSFIYILVAIQELNLSIKMEWTDFLIESSTSTKNLKAVENI
jgi:hypothetical protein